MKKKASENALSSKLKAVCDLKYPKIDKQVLSFVLFNREAKKPVILASISTRALIARNKLLQTAPEQERYHLSKFHASKKWALSFTQRHALRSVALHGGAGSASTVQVAREISKIREQLASNILDRIYIVDETGLFFKLIPRWTYVKEK